jgi:hypothetical protein
MSKDRWNVATANDISDMVWLNLPIYREEGHRLPPQSECYLSPYLPVMGKGPLIYLYCRAKDEANSLEK